MDGDPSIAIYLTKVYTFTTYTPQMINKGAGPSGLGKTQDTRQ